MVSRVWRSALPHRTTFSRGATASRLGSGICLAGPADVSGWQRRKLAGPFLGPERLRGVELQPGPLEAEYDGAGPLHCLRDRAAGSNWGRLLSPIGVSAPMWKQLGPALEQHSRHECPGARPDPSEAATQQRPRSLAASYVGRRACLRGVVRSMTTDVALFRRSGAPLGAGLCATRAPGDLARPTSRRIADRQPWLPTDRPRQGRACEERARQGRCSRVCAPYACMTPAN